MAKSTAVTKKKEEQLPAAPDDFFDGPDSFAGVGREDISLPRFTILQGLSPQINKRSDEYVPGAEIGQIINVATGEIYEKLPVIFAAYQRRYVEWKIRAAGGGLVQDHGQNGDVLKHFEQNDRGQWFRADNPEHQLVVTGTWYVIHPETLTIGFIAMGNTHFTSSRNIMAAVREQRVETSKGLRQAQMYMREWELTSRLRSNDQGEWFTWKATPGRWLHTLENRYDILETVKGFYKQLEADAVTIDLSGEEDVAPSGGDSQPM